MHKTPFFCWLLIMIAEEGADLMKWLQSRGSFQCMVASGSGMHKKPFVITK